MTDNVLEFPKHKIVREAINETEEVIVKAKEKGRAKFADTIVDDLVDMAVEELENCGIDTDDKNFLKDFSMAADAIRATIYRQFNLEHNLHKFIDENVKMVNRKTGELIAEDELDEEE